MKQNIDDIEELELLEAIENGEFVSTANLEDELAIAKKAAENYMRKNSRINIRLPFDDVDRIKIIAAQEGLPYQTLIASVIHKFVSGRLVDRSYVDSILKPHKNA